MPTATTSTIALQPVARPLRASSGSPTRTSTAHLTLLTARSATPCSTAASTPAASPHPTATASLSNENPLGSGSGNATDANGRASQLLVRKSRKGKFKAKAAIEIVVAAFAIFGVVWATFVSLPSLRLQRWSASNDFLQACLAIENPLNRPTKCNDAIHTGPVPPPNLKRSLHVAASTVVADSPGALAAASVLTLCALVLATIYFRPRMEPFHPLISMARSCAAWHIPREFRRSLVCPQKRMGWAQISTANPYGILAWTSVSEHCTIADSQSGATDVDDLDLEHYFALEHESGAQGELSQLDQRASSLYEADEEPSEDIVVHQWSKPSRNGQDAMVLVEQPSRGRLYSSESSSGVSSSGVQGRMMR